MGLWLSGVVSLPFRPYCCGSGAWLVVLTIVLTAEMKNEKFMVFEGLSDEDGGVDEDMDMGEGEAEGFDSDTADDTSS